MLYLLFEFDFILVDIDNFTVYPCSDEALFAYSFDYFFVFTFSLAYYRRKHIQLGACFHGHYPVYNLVYRLT